MTAAIIIIFGLFIVYLISEFYTDNDDPMFVVRTGLVVVITAIAIIATMLLFEYREKAEGICPTYELVQEPVYKRIP